MAPDHDRNLLFGVLALQLEIIDRDQFAKACNDWALESDKPLAHLLKDRGWITPEDEQEITRNLQRKLKKHRGDAHASLAAAADTSVREVLQTIDQPSIRQSLNELPPRVGHLMIESVIARRHGDSSSRYTVSKIHGQGGLGRVWVATDCDLNRRVALKEIVPHHDSNPLSIPLFLNEAQITGQLQHPNIVPVYELSWRKEKEGDKPFYTMRFIEGRSFEKVITQFRKDHDGKPLDRAAFQKELLEPFLKICDAVGFAHSRDVVHRDLKPQNVVLGDYGEVIVLDWGLAKLMTEPGDPEATVVENRIKLSDEAKLEATQGRVGTPSYMAPEQAAADDATVGPCSDIYGLGGILYAILTGRPPVQGRTIEQVLQDVVAGRISRPTELDPKLPKGLEAICLKALNVRPEDRYPSAAALADDVRRWLADEPVSVYRDPFTVRLTRWGRKHRTLVTSAVAVLAVATFAGCLVAAQQSLHARAIGKSLIREQAARKLAEDRKKLADENFTLALDTVKAQVFDINEQLNDRAGTRVLREKLQKSATDRLKSLIERTSQRGEVDHTAFWARSNLADVYLNVDARPTLAKAEYDEAHRIAKQLAEAEPRDTQAQRDLLVSYNNLGDVQLQSGKTTEALAYYTKSLEISRKLAGANLADAKAKRDLWLSYDRVSEVELRIGKPSESLATSTKALEIAKEIADANPTDTGAQRDLSVSYNTLGRVQMQAGNSIVALDLLTKGLEIRKKLADADPADAQAHRDLGVSYDRLGDILFATGKQSEAFYAYSKSLEIAEDLLDTDPADARAQRDLSVSYNKLGDLRLQTGKPAEATEWYTKGLEIRKKLADADSADSQAQRDLSISYEKLGDLQMRTGEPTKALASFSISMAIRQKRVETDPADAQAQRDLSVAYDKLGNVQLHTGKLAEALAAYSKSLELSKKLVDADPADSEVLTNLAVGHYKIGRTFKEKGEWSKALGAFRESLTVVRRLFESGRLKASYLKMSEDLENLIGECEAMMTAKP